ncbi:MAG: hypothetical protein K2J80_10935 [Oscillospiraceae bacterium]|nr:hypothetical protein [Oscillospiraceae bacterium]
MKKNRLGFAAGLLAAALVFNGVGSNTHMVFAETVDNSQFEISPDRICYAQVDMSCFTNSALDYVDEYVAQDEDGYYYITDGAALKELLTPEQYALVEEQITAVNDDMALYAATGTERNPDELTEGQRKEVKSSASEYWFSCIVGGATDFYFSVSPSVIFDFSIYKKKLFGKDLIENSSEKSSFYRVLSNCAVNNGANTYLVKITPKSSATNTFAAKITQHRDSNNVYKDRGAIWKPDNNTAIPSSIIIYNRYWYVPKDSVQILVDYILDDKFIEYQEKLIAGTITALGIAAGLFPQKVNTAIGIISGCMGLFVPDLKAELINKIRTAAGYSNGTYKNGVLLTEYMQNSTALIFHDVKPWDGGTMYGPSGWTGSWSAN